MTVLCVNSTVVYADITAADAAEGGTDYGVPTRYEQTGASSSSVVFSGGDYPSSIVYIATTGEETDGTTLTGAQCTGLITSSVDNALIQDLRTGRITFVGVNHSNLNLVSNGGGGDAYLFDTTNAATSTNCIRYNCSEGCRANSTNDNYIETNCTVVDATGFGVLRPRAVDSVSLNTNSSAYLQVGASSSNYWADDGTGSNTITEGTPTDIFENYAGGDYRIKPSSSPGVAGAGAFINSGGGGISLTIDPIDQTQTIEQVTLTQHSIISIGGLSQAQTVDQVTLQQSGTLSINNLQHIQTIDQVNLTQAHIVSVNDLSQLQAVDQVSLNQGNVLSVNDTDQLQSIDQVTLSTAGTVAINNASQAQALEQLVLSIAGTVTINNLSQSQLLEQLNLTQAHVLSVDNLSQAQLLESINFNGVVVGYLQGALTIVSAYNGQIKLTNPLTGEIRIL